MLTKKSIKLSVLSLSIAAILGACHDSNSSTSGATTPGVNVTLSGLENLGADYVYEGWIMVNGSPKSSGRFSINDAGALSQSTFSLSSDDAAKATAFILTIEPAKNDPPAASNIHVLAGDINAQGFAKLETKHPAALNTDFATASGAYILATPSTASITTDEDQGIWWLTPTGPSAGLKLPTLPAGWVYEGWVVDTSSPSPQPVSTGTFTNASGADSDKGGATAGPDATPPFPGQDFINPSRKLPGMLAVISIEPSPDNSPAPFALKPLQHRIANVTAPTVQTMENVYSTGTQKLPSGTVQINK